MKRRHCSNKHHRHQVTLLNLQHWKVFTFKAHLLPFLCERGYKKPGRRAQRNFLNDHYDEANKYILFFIANVCRLNAIITMTSVELSHTNFNIVLRYKSIFIDLILCVCVCAVLTGFILIFVLLANRKMVLHAADSMFHFDLWNKSPRSRCLIVGLSVKNSLKSGDPDFVCVSVCAQWWFATTMANNASLIKFIFLHCSSPIRIRDKMSHFTKIQLENASSLSHYTDEYVGIDMRWHKIRCSHFIRSNQMTFEYIKFHTRILSINFCLDKTLFFFFIILVLGQLSYYWNLFWQIPSPTAQSGPLHQNIIGLW